MSSTPLTTLSPLRCSLRHKQSVQELSLAVFREIWIHDFRIQEYGDHQKDYNSYFSHIYQDLTVAACSGDSQIPDFTHEKILEIVRRLKYQALTKSEAIQSFPTRGCHDTARVERAVNLAAGLLVPLNFKSAGGARRGAVVLWEAGQTLHQMVEKEMRDLVNITNSFHSTCTSCDSTWNFQTSFNARQLVRIAGFEIIWTSNLLDHLLLQDGDESLKLHIFHQVKILESHLKFSNVIISHNLILETIDTLALLLPRTDRRVRKWYQKFQRMYILDSRVLSLEYLKPEHRNIDHFTFWGGRLRKVKQAFDGHEPHGPLQWWRDDRKPVQWWTFWIAALILVLTIVFGFTQSITSIIQVAKS